MKLERAAFWLAIGGGGFMMACGLGLSVYAASELGEARDGAVETREQGMAVLATVDQCAAQVERMQRVMTGPLVPHVIVPTPLRELPQLGTGGP